MDALGQVLNRFRGRRLVVTGAGGFIGGALAHKLSAAGAEVTSFDRQHGTLASVYSDTKVRFVRGDLAQRADVAKALKDSRPDLVFHLGAQAIVGIADANPYDTFESNVRGTYNLLEECRTTGTPVVVASSDKAYGTAAQLPYTEETPLRGVHPYEVSKSAADLIALSYANSLRCAVTVARCGNVFGPGDLAWSRLVPGTARSLAVGETPVIRSDGRLIRDYVFLDDILRAYGLLGLQIQDEKVRGHAFNFGTRQPRTVLDVVESMISAAGKPNVKPKILGGAATEIPAQYLSSDRARDYLGWRPEVPFDAALAATYAWYARFVEHQPPLASAMPTRPAPA